jgi:DMSO/TMAO reductase YedYZ molybdopterin-dependent catalytic subunit
MITPPPSPDAELKRTSARTAGFLATVVVLTGLWAVSSISADIPFPPTAVAERIVRETPGDVATFFIERLQHWALRLLTAGALLGALLIGTEALVRTAARGVLRPWPAAGVLGMFSAAAALVHPSMDLNVPGVIAVSAAGAVVYALLSGSVYRSLTAEADTGRRRVLRLGVGGAAGLALAGGVVGWIARRLQGPNTNVPLVGPATSASIPDRATFPDITGHTPEVTSADDHYVVDINLIQPSVEADSWTLRVHGRVDNELDLGFYDLQRRFEVVEEYSVLTCISNKVGGPLVGHSAWGGVRLGDVLDAAGVHSVAVDIVFRAADGYSDSIPLTVARNPAVMLAVSQNGEPLKQEHGFPCRVRIPAIYGMKNVKWVESIEVVDFDYKGYWMKRGWSDVATVRTQSRIDVAGDDGRAIVGEPTWIAGVAWAGERGISKVEVSTDGAEEWAEAELKEPITAVSWHLWAFRWTPEAAGDVLLACRATDGDGNVQIAEVSDPHPSGATGYHFVELSVS